MGPAMMSPVSDAAYASFNTLSNSGRLEYRDGIKTEKADGTETIPTYSNKDEFSFGRADFREYWFIGINLENYQAQAIGGVHWRKRIALGYFPVLTLSGQHLLHGLQLDLKLPVDLGILSAQIYQENIPSILMNAALGEAGPVLQHRVAGVSLGIPLNLRYFRIWIVPNYRQSLDHDLFRYGANLVVSVNEGGVRN